MSLEILASEILLDQIKKLDGKSKRILSSKIDLIKLNPFRFKRIHSKRFSQVFRVKLNVNNAESRLIYTILGNKIFLICLLDRKHDYKDLENYLGK